MPLQGSLLDSSRAELPKVIRSETAILQVAAKETKRATANSIRKSKTEETLATYIGQRINTSWSFPDAKWASYIRTLKSQSKKKQKSRIGDLQHLLIWRRN
jgi:hypothetical protein